MTEENVIYLDGDVVWVKLLSCWWPGEVLSLDKVPPEVRESFKQPPLAVVRFFQEDTFEYVRNGHSKNICLYTTEKKNDYIKRGMDLVRSKAKAALMVKFPADVCTAERLTGGNPNILNEPQFAPEVTASCSVAVKRRNSSGSGAGGTPGRGRGRAKGGARGGKGRGRMSTGAILENKFFATPSPKKLKPNKEIIVTHPRFINDDIDDHEVVELIQTKRPSLDPPPVENIFTCNTCGFKTTRVDVLVMHREMHYQKPIKRKTTSPPKKPRRKTYQMPRSRTKTLEEDIALVRSGKTVEDFLSDTEETPKKRAKKTKQPPKEKKKTTPKERKERTQQKDDDTLKIPEKTNKIDREQLVAEWNEIEESEDEAQEENKQPDVAAIKSCFDFDEEDSEEILTGDKVVEGRKIPRVIPEAELPKHDNEIAATPAVEDHDGAAAVEEEEVLPEKLVAENLKSNLGLETFEEILQATNVPKLPDIPQIREKCEQNFHNTRAIKFPDKNDTTPIQIDKSDESNGLLTKPLDDYPQIVPVKTDVVATKLTNPKKRFVRSFQEEKAKVQDRLDQLEKEKTDREKAPQDNDKEVLLMMTHQQTLSTKEVAVSERVLQMKEEITATTVEKESLSAELDKVGDEELTIEGYNNKAVSLKTTKERRRKKKKKKSHCRSSTRKIDNSTKLLKYKSKRHYGHSELERKPQIIDNIVNSFLDDEDVNENGDIHEVVAKNSDHVVVNDLISNDERLIDLKEQEEEEEVPMIMDRSELAKEIPEANQIPTEGESKKIDDPVKEGPTGDPKEEIAEEPAEKSREEIAGELKQPPAEVDAENEESPSAKSTKGRMEPEGEKSQITKESTEEIEAAVEEMTEESNKILEKSREHTKIKLESKITEESTEDAPKEIKVENKITEESAEDDCPNEIIEKSTQDYMEIKTNVKITKEPTEELPPLEETVVLNVPEDPEIDETTSEQSTLVDLPIHQLEETLVEDVPQELTNKLPEELITEVAQELTNELPEEPIPELPQEPIIHVLQHKEGLDEVQHLKIEDSLNQIEASQLMLVNNISTDGHEETCELEDPAKDFDDIRTSPPKKRTIKSNFLMIDDYESESTDIISSEKEKDKDVVGSEEDYCCTSLPSSLPESPNDEEEEVVTSSNLEQTETRREEEEFEVTVSGIIIPEDKKLSPEESIELHEASILINTGTHNPEELSALNTLATLSEMIQPEFDVRALRKDDNSLLSSFDSAKEINHFLENSTELDDNRTDDIPPPETDVVIDDEPVDVNGTMLPEVLDKITVFPDEQLVKGQMEIVTLNSSDPVVSSNDSCSKTTDLDLEIAKENVSVLIAETIKSSEEVRKSFVVNEPECPTDLKELSTEHESIISLENPKTESISAIENINEEEDNVAMECDNKSENTNEDATIKRITVPEETPVPPSSSSVVPLRNNKNEHQEGGGIISPADTLAAAIANTIESEMAKLTDTALDMATLPIQQRETSSSKLLEILSEPKPLVVPDKPPPPPPKRSQVLMQKKQFVLTKTKTSATSSSNKTIILSDQVIKPARNETDSVVVQKVSNKRTLEDFEDIDAYIIQKPGKKPPALKSDLDNMNAPPAPKMVKKSSPRSRPRILQQTIITAAGDVIQPDGQQIVDDQSMFDINSMPIVLSDQILTPECLDNMPMILQDGLQSSKVIKTSQTVKLLNKTPTESVNIIKSSPKAVFRGYHKAPQQRIQKKGGNVVTTTTAMTTMPGAQVKTNYILVPSGGGSPSPSLPGGRKSALKRQGSSQILLQSTKGTAPTAGEPTGNKIMIVTNNLGQQQRVVLTPAQHKMFIQQNSGKLRTTTTTTATAGGGGSRLVKANQRPNILTHQKTHLISTTPSGGQGTQTFLLAPTQMITPLTPQQMKAATKVAGSGHTTKLKVTKYIHTTQQQQQVGNQNAAKTIIIRNQQGHTVKKLHAGPDADLDRQVAEQIEAIKAAEAVKSNVGGKVSVEQGKKQVMMTAVKKTAVTSSVKQQQQVQQQRVKKMLLSGVAKSVAVPPLAPLVVNPEATVSSLDTVLTTSSIASSSPTVVPSAAPTTDNNVPITSSVVSPTTEKDGEKRQLVMQDDQGNMSAIPVGQILAIPNETVDGQAQSYVLVTMDETGNLIPLNQETLMSIDPNILGNMVVQNNQQVDDAPPKLPSPPPPPPPPPPAVVEVPPPEPDVLDVMANANLHSTTCNINNGDVNKQVVITGDPVVTHKFLESLAGNQELFNLIANASGTLLIHTDGHQILINTTNAAAASTTLLEEQTAESAIMGDRNPVMSNPSTKSHDILAAALADTDVLPPTKSSSSQLLSPGSSSSLYHPLHASSNVLETSSAMNSPIMTPLEVTETHSKKIDLDILGQVPKSVSDHLPITITDPNIAQTVVAVAQQHQQQQQLDLTIPDHHHGTGTSVVGCSMNSPSSFPSPYSEFSQAISMPLLSDEPTDGVSSNTTKKEYSFVNRMCSRICSSLSEPPPDMFDYPPTAAVVAVVASEEEDEQRRGEEGLLLQKVMTAAFEQQLVDDGGKGDDELVVLMAEGKMMDERVKGGGGGEGKEELFEPNLTPQFHSPSTNTDDSCEIPVQPPIVTTTAVTLDDDEDDEGGGGKSNDLMMSDDDDDDDNKNVVV